MRGKGGWGGVKEEGRVRRYEGEGRVRRCEGEGRVGRCEGNEWMVSA